MNFLQKLDFMMAKYSLNKSSLSQKSGIPYTTIDGWYKKGYDGMKLSTLRTLSDYFNTVLDYWATDEITDPNAWKTNGFVVDTGEMEYIQKYRILDSYGKEAVEKILDIENKRCSETGNKKLEGQENENKVLRFRVPEYMRKVSAGTGQEADLEFPEDLELTKAPPRGTSYVARVSGDSMEPTYSNGDLIFVHSCEEIPVGRVGVFLMDGQQWVKELGDGVLISHNPDYPPRSIAEGARCQGLVLGVCDGSYFE